MSKNKIKKTKQNKINDMNIIGGFGILIFCIIFVFIFTTRFIQSPSNDSNRKYCADCSLKTGREVYHNLDGNADTNEIWCENCNKWHAPKNENVNPQIK